jgi:hypothetical protein
LGCQRFTLSRIIPPDQDQAQAPLEEDRNRQHSSNRKRRRRTTASIIQVTRLHRVVLLDKDLDPEAVAIDQVQHQDQVLEHQVAAALLLDLVVGLQVRVTDLVQDQLTVQEHPEPLVSLEHPVREQVVA